MNSRFVNIGAYCHGYYRTSMLLHTKVKYVVALGNQNL